MVETMHFNLKLGIKAGQQPGTSLPGRLRQSKRLLTSLIAAILFLLAIAPVSQADINLPEPTGFVSDFAGKLSDPSRQQLEGLLTNFRDRSSGIEVTVVTVPYDWLGGYAIEDYALQLGRKWKIGGGSDKAGLLLLVAIMPPDGQGVYHGETRLEVGRHLEGEIPDGLAGATISQMRDDFRAGRFDQAINKGVQTILATIAKQRGISMEGIDQRYAYSGRQSRRRSGGFSPIAIIGFVILIFFILSAIGRGRGGPGGRSGRRRFGSDWMIWPIIFGGGGPGGFGGYRGGSDWGGFDGGGRSGGGGGFGGFGGGGDFGGGGASDSW